MSPPPTRDRDRDRAQAELEAQLQALVRSTQALTVARFEADDQLQRIHALNTFSLQAAAAADPERILGRAGELLLELFPLEQALGLLSSGEALLPVMLRARAGCGGKSVEHLLGETPSPVEGMAVALETPWMGLARDIPDPVAALLPVLEALYVDACEWSFDQAEAFILLLPLESKRPRRLGYLIVRATRPGNLGAHERLPTATDLPFLELLTAHLAQALDNTLLHTEVSELAAELEARVERRTAELERANAALDQNLRELEMTQAELLHAGRMAAVGTLVAGVSHELSKPVLIIEGYARALLEEPLDADQSRRALESIVRQAGRCANLIEGLLAFSRKPAAPRERYPVEELLADVTSLADSHARKHKVRLFTEITLRAVPEIEGIRTELQSALLNLVSNAIDASPAGGQVQVRVTPETRAGRPGVIFEVKDEGEGIAEAIQAQIFDPFFTTKPTGEGVGLGLALTDRIAAAHHGAIEVAATSETGTSMRLWLPAA